MEAENVLALLKQFDAGEATVLRLRQGDFSLELEKPAPAGKVSAAPVPAVSAESLAAAEAAPPAAEGITAPLAGTFYRAPGEDAPPFVDVGDVVEKGQVIGIIEAMKVMNEVTSPVRGTVTAIVVENGSLVGYHDLLIQVDEHV